MSELSKIFLHGGQVKLIKLIVGVLVFLMICLVIVAGAVYFWVWPMAQQQLASLSELLRQPPAGIEEALPALPAEEWGIGINEFLGALPMLERIGLDGLSQIQGLAEGGFTAEEAQQALAILQEKLSAAELSQLTELLPALPIPQ